MAQSLEPTEEDCVKYMLFPNLSCSKDDHSRREMLEKCMDDYMAKLSPYLIDYLWHNEPFQLRIVNNETFEAPPHLEGTTKFGDNVEDEWFITYLLIQLTKSEDDLIVKIIDNDGEFLLIEAAYYLPKWLNPDTSENRVYVYRGNIHIIGSTHSSASNEKLSISDAVKYVRKNSNATKANSDIQQAIASRLEGYPEKINQFQHRTHCYVPASIAAILKHQPSLVAAAVQAFYLREPIDLKACKIMKYFPPETRVMTEVTFTKCMYAQLIQQQYTPDAKVGWNLPPCSSKEFKSHDLGMKLACGFEILLAGVKKTKEDDTLLPADLDFNNDRRWIRFLQSLKAKDYFRSELEGSRLYQQLLKEAQSFYCENVAKSPCQTPGLKILHLLEILPINYEELKEEENQLRPPDDDSWLEITPQELEDLLLKHANMCGNDTSYSQIEKELPDSIKTGLKSFIKHKSSVDGAEFPKLKTSKRKPSDEDNFPNAINSILDFHVPDSDDDSSSDMSGYSDEDDMDLSAKGVTKKKAGEVIEGIKEYMEQMDKELQSTSIGLSFEKLPKSSSENSNDKTIQQSDEPQKPSPSSNVEQDADELTPVNVDLNALKNILESYSCQQGLPGPASNLLSSMGICLPCNQDVEQT